MTTFEKYKELQKREINARSNEEIDAIRKEMTKLADDDPRGFEEAVILSARRTLEDARQLKVKEQLKAMSEIVSMSYIAKNYFNKTKSWLSQRINELNVNGKPAKFTQEEIDILNAAFKDLSEKIGAVHVSL